MGKELGQIFKEKRIWRRMTITDLSKFSRVDPKTISLIEKGVRKKPNYNTIKNIAEILWLEPRDMLHIAGYTDEEIKEHEVGPEENATEFKFHVLITGHGKVYAENLEQAYDYIEDIITDQVQPKDYIDEYENTIFNKNFNIIVDFERESETEWKNILYI